MDRQGRSMRYGAAFKRWVRAVLTVLMVLPLAASCYVPDDFLAEIRLAANGDYAFVFKGSLIWAPLVQEIRNGDLTPEEVREKQAIIQRDLERDSHFRSIEPQGNGRFRVFYERLGRFTGTRKVTFVRRSAEILGMETRTDGTVHIRGGGTNGRNPQELLDLRINPEGRLRIITNVPEVQQNAQKVTLGMPGYPDYRIYDWSLDLTTPTPVFIGQLLGRR